MRCVECGAVAAAAYREYSPGNVRLVDCACCGKAVDPYIECELVVVVIDLILHRPQAYRHLLHNRLSTAALADKQRCCLEGFVLVAALDTWRCQLTGRLKLDGERPGRFVRDTIILFGLMALANVLHTLVVAAVLDLRMLTKQARIVALTQGLLLASLFKLLTCAMAIWTFSPAMARVMDALVLTSNYTAIQVWQDAAGRRLALLSAVAGAAARHCTEELLLPLLLRR